MLFAAAQTIARGRSAGWLAALGIHVGGYAHVIAAALGLSVLFTAVPVLYSIVKLAGAGYLIWLGIQLFRSTKDLSGAPSLVDNPRHPKRTFWESVTVEVLNPKTAIFYIAFLPQFTDPAATLPLWGQLMILGTFVNVAFSSADILCVLLSSTVVKFLKRSPTGNRIVQRIGGGVLVTLGINLAVSGQ